MLRRGNWNLLCLLFFYIRRFSLVKGFSLEVQTFRQLSHLEWFFLSAALCRQIISFPSLSLSSSASHVSLPLPPSVFLPSLSLSSRVYEYTDRDFSLSYPFVFQLPLARPDNPRVWHFFADGWNSLCAAEPLCFATMMALHVTLQLGSLYTTTRLSKVACRRFSTSTRNPYKSLYLGLIFFNSN